MSSIRFNGPSEQMGTVVSTHEVSEADIYTGQQDVHRIIDRLQLGTIALSAVEFRVPDIDSRSIRASFINSEKLAAGRDEGQHQARFGQIIFNGNGYYERPVLAAIKPFAHATENHPDAALANEWAVNNYLNSLGNRQLAYLPLGIWRNSEDINHLITLYEHDVISYDSIFWADRDTHPEALRKASVEHGLFDCIRGLGYLHGVGLVHTDSEAKNLAADFNGIRFIDTESVRTLAREGKKIDDSAQTTNLLRNDIEMFFDSTMQVDDNREPIKAVLSKSKMPEKLAQAYRAGLRIAKVDSGLVLPDVATKYDEYFEATIAHTLNYAANSKL